MGARFEHDDTGKLYDSRTVCVPSNADWLMCDGEMAERIRGFDWSSTSLGAREYWPTSLRTVLNLVVESKVPMVLLWGPELLTLYNDTCIEIFAERHPGALARPAREVWPEAWYLSEQVVSAVMNQGKAFFRKDVYFSIQRHGHREDVYFTLADSPVRLEDGSIGGVIVTFHETTAAVEHLRKLEQTQKTLRASEQKYAAIFEHAPFAMSLTKMPEGTLAAVNDYFLQLFECDRDDVIGKTSIDVGISDPDSQAQVRAEFQAHGKLRNWECCRKTKSGAERILSLNLDWVIIAGERQVLTTIHDISARKEAEEAKRLYAQTQLAEAKFRGIISISADAIVTVDVNHDIIEWNQGAEHIFGYSRAEAIGMPLRALIPERYRESHREHVARFASERQMARRMNHQYAIGRRKSGEEFPIAATISRLNIADEVFMTAAIRDISEEKRIENELRIRAEFGTALASLDYENTLRELVHVAVHSLADFAWLVVPDGEGRMRPVVAASRDPAKSWCADVIENAPAAQSMGISTGSVLSTRRASIQEITPDKYEAIAPTSEHLRAIRAAEPRSLLGIPLLVGEQCHGVLMIASSSRMYDNRDLQLMEEVGRQCALFVENARLHRAEKLATRARDDVLSVVAHDLRNPLGVIIVEAAMLARQTSPSPARTKKIALAIDRCAARMNRIIEDLLDVVRFEAEGLRINVANQSPEHLIADAVETQNALASAASLELRVDVAPNLPDISADRDRLLQVFENLIGNAIKFSAPGGVIVVGATQTNVEVLFRVVDTGVGIAAEDLPNVFDRFWRKDTVKNRGAGLGLPIVKGIVEAHGGRVWVESAIGVGSSFHFTIPVAGGVGERVEER